MTSGIDPIWDCGQTLLPRALKWLRKVINKSLGSGWIMKNRQIAERPTHTVKVLNINRVNSTRKGTHAQP